jgi:hypothetical protein
MGIQLHSLAEITPLLPNSALLFLLICYCLPGPANLPSTCRASGLAGNDNKELRG